MHSNCVKGTADQAINGDQNRTDLKIAEKKCIFCDRHDRRMKRKTDSLHAITSSIQKNRILHILSILNEAQKIEQIKNDPSIFYHKSCLATLRYRYVEPQKLKQRKDSPPSEEIHVESFESNTYWQNRIKSVTFQIHQEVMSLNRRDLPQRNITLQDLRGGECDTPELLHLFIESLVNGPNGSASEVQRKRIECICHSIIYSMSSDSIKPSTSLCLGLVAKSLTENSQIVDVLHRMGYSISNDVVEELVTKLALDGSIQNHTLLNRLIANDVTIDESAGPSTGHLEIDDDASDGNYEFMI